MKKLALSLILVITSSLAHANNREVHRFGVYGSLIGEPYISIVGVNVGINPTAFMRVIAGFGQWTPTFTYTDGTKEQVRITTYGFGAKFMLPEANFTPFIGIHYGNMSFSHVNKTISTGTYGYGGEASISFPYVSVGLDWTASTGFYFAAGFSKPIGVLAHVQGLPFLSIGWFF